MPLPANYAIIFGNYGFLFEITVFSRKGKQKQAEPEKLLHKYYQTNGCASMKEKGTNNSDFAKRSIIRHVFRLPIDDQDNVSIIINGATFEVINIGANGVGLLVDSDVPLAEGQTLPVIELRLENELLSLKGRVVHISPREFQMICGIEFVKTSKKNTDKILQFLRLHRETLFKEI